MTYKQVKSGDRLLPREAEILALLAKGFTNAEIGGVLNMATGTVENWLTNIYTKLNINSRIEAAVRACEMGLHGSPAAKCEELPEALVARLLTECDHEPGTHIDAATLMRFANRLAAEVRGVMPAQVA